MVGTVSRPARVSVARRNLKEAAGKVPAPDKTGPITLGPVVAEGKK